MKQTHQNKPQGIHDGGDLYLQKDSQMQSNLESMFYDFLTHKLNQATVELDRTQRKSAENKESLNEYLSPVPTNLQKSSFFNQNSTKILQFEPDPVEDFLSPGMTTDA